MSSSIPSAVAGFLTLMRAVLPATTTVVFSKPLPVYTAPLTLQVSAVEGIQEPAELAPSMRREEHYVIICELTSYQGDQDTESRLVETMSAWATITTAIANDPYLTGTPGGTGSAGPVRFAQPGNMVFTPDVDPKGQSIGRLSFEVHCEARITSLT